MDKEHAEVSIVAIIAIAIVTIFVSLMLRCQADHRNCTDALGDGMVPEGVKHELVNNSTICR